jgi:hypothetical protein
MPSERHQVRIEAKKLRYGLDFLASLWQPERLRELTVALVQAQDLLGQMNDRVSAQRLLATAPKAGADRLQMVLGAQLVESAAHLRSGAEGADPGAGAVEVSTCSTHSDPESRSGRCTTKPYALLRQKMLISLRFSRAP